MVSISNRSLGMCDISYGAKCPLPLLLLCYRQHHLSLVVGLTEEFELHQHSKATEPETKGEKPSTLVDIAYIQKAIRLTLGAIHTPCDNTKYNM